MRWLVPLGLLLAGTSCGSSTGNSGKAGGGAAGSSAGSGGAAEAGGGGAGAKSQGSGGDSNLTAPIGGGAGTGVGGSGVGGSGGSAGSAPQEPECDIDDDCADLDVDLCEGSHVCVEGSCALDPATKIVCAQDDAPLCKVYTCVPSTGECVLDDAADGLACDDGLFCTKLDACRAGACEGSGSPCDAPCVTCDEAEAACPVLLDFCYIGNVCYADGWRKDQVGCEACDASDPGVWSHGAVGEGCNDGDACTESDACKNGGVCAGAVKAPAAPQLSSTEVCSNSPTGRRPSFVDPHPRRPTISWTQANDGCGDVTWSIELDDSCEELDGCGFESPELSKRGLSARSFTPENDLALHEELPAATVYRYRVRADRGGRSSAWSDDDSVLVGHLPNDVNGDGYSDVVVRRSVYPASPTYVLTYHPGGPDGPPATPAVVMPSPYISDDPFEKFGDRIVLADLNGDGFDDVVAEGDDHPGLVGGESQGRFYVYNGGPDGPPTTPSLTVYNKARLTQGFPRWLAAADVNGDGYADVVTPTGTYAETAPVNVMYFYPGSSNGISDMPVAQPFLELGGSGYGLNLGAPSDVNGDCLADMLLHENNVSVARGTGSGPGSPDLILSHSRLVWGAASGGNVNGDAYSDLVIRARPPDMTEPEILVYWGPFKPYLNQIVMWCDTDGDGFVDLALEGPGHCPDQRIQVPAGKWYLSGLVQIGGDMNGDGYSDLMWLNEKDSELNFHFGSSKGLSLTPSGKVSGYANELGYLGDTNNDGYDDVWMYRQLAGKQDMVVHFGGPSGLSNQSLVVLDKP